MTPSCLGTCTLWVPVWASVPFSYRNSIYTPITFGVPDTYVSQSKCDSTFVVLIGQSASSKFMAVLSKAAVDPLNAGTLLFVIDSEANIVTQVSIYITLSICRCKKMGRALRITFFCCRIDLSYFVACSSDRSSLLF